MGSVCRHITQQSFFCITARVNVRNSISDLLDWKLWVQIPDLKNMSSVLRTWRIWVQFSGLNFWDLEKIDGKKQKISKIPNMPKNRFQKCPNVFWTCFEAIFPNFFAQCSMQGFSDFLDLKIWAQISGLKNKSLVFRTYIYEFSFTTQYSTDILFAFTPQWIYAIAFQMFWN